MKGIILAGGSGTRLFPLTKSISKQILPVYDKPAICYPLSILMLAGIREILIISTERDTPMIRNLLGNGKDLGIDLQYAVQDQPNGIAEAFKIGGSFIGNDQVCLILGDNIFYGHKLGDVLVESANQKSGARVFAYRVTDPQNFGVVTFDNNGKALSIEEKPRNPSSNWAITGLYFYDNQVLDIVKSLKPSDRGELEITDVNRAYLDSGQLDVHAFGRGVAWLDMGTFDSLAVATQFVQTVEKRQGLKIGCLEEVSFSKGYISGEQLQKLAETYPNSPYRAYLINLALHGHM